MSKRARFVLGLGLLVAAFAAGPAMALQAIIPPTQGFGLMTDSERLSNTCYTNYYYGAHPLIFFKYNLSAISVPEGNSLTVTSAVFQNGYTATWLGVPFMDGLWTRDDNFDNNTTTWANRGTRGDLLATWSFDNWTQVTISNASLATYVQSQFDGDKMASFWIEDYDGNGLSGTSHCYYAINYPNQTFKLIVNYTLTALPPATTPVISPASGSYSTPQTVTITADAGATIRYTLDGSDPASTSPIYSGPFTVSKGTAVRAMAITSGHSYSAVAAAAYTFPAVGTILDIIPIQDVTVGTVPDYPKWADGTIGTGYYYGGLATYLKYDLSAIPAPEGCTVTINSACVKGWGASNPAIFQDGLFVVTDNTWTEDNLTWANKPAAGGLLVAWDTVSTGFTTLPSDNLTGYVQSKLTGSKLMSVALLSVLPQTVASHTYYDRTVVGWGEMCVRVDYTLTLLPPATTPVISPASGTYTTPQTMSITADAGATIRYTLDGTNPTSSSPVYTGSFTVGKSTVVKAIAITSGHSYSAVAKASYDIVVGATVDVFPLYDACVYTPGGQTGKATNSLLNTGVYGQSLTYICYLMYDLSSVPELSPPPGYTLTINSVCVDGYQAGNASRPYQDAYFAVADNSWTEASITLETRPEVGSLLVAWDAIDWDLFKAPSQALTDYVVAAMAGDKKASVCLQSAVSLWSPTVGIITHAYYDKDYPDLADYNKMKLLVDYSYIKLPTAATPTFSPKAGQFWQAQTVTISTTTPGATIRYTLNETDPTDDNTSGIVYTGPITVSDVTTIKARAFAPASAGLYASDVATARYDFPTLINAPTDVPQGSVTVDANLADWAGCVWAPLDQDYDQIASDISQAFYSAKWTANKVYVAVKVYDTQHHFTDNYTNWNVHDAAEFYLHTIGSGPTDYYTTQADAQEYTVGMKADGVNHWAAIGYDFPTDLAGAGFQAAARVSGNWLFYEVAMTPYEFFSLSGTGLVQSPLSVGQVIGIDATAVSVNSTGGYLGMKSENPMIHKSSDYTAIGVHRLVAASSVVTTNADLQAVLAAMDSTASSVNWNVAADFDSDGEVTSSDLAFVLAHLQ